MHLRSPASVVADLAYVDHLDEVGSDVRERYRKLKEKLATALGLHAAASAAEMDTLEDAEELAALVAKRWSSAEVETARHIEILCTPPSP